MVIFGFAEYAIFNQDKVVSTPVVKIDLVWFIYLQLPFFPISDQSTKYGILKSMSLPNLAVPGEDSSIVWYVEQITKTMVALSLQHSNIHQSLDFIFEDCHLTMRD